MRLAACLVLALLLFGCAAEGGPNGTNTTSLANATGITNATNVTNATNATNVANATNVTNATDAANASYATFTTPLFSFRYPPALEVEKTSYGYGGVFTGRHQLPQRTGEVLAVAYMNTSYTFGANADEEYRVEPTLAASGFLQKDLRNDSMGFLNRGAETGNTSTFSIGRDVFIAEAPFTLRFSPATPYTGYAMALYVPERSLLVKVRILALDPEIAKEMRDQFLLSFRVE